jgi:cytochrome c biogenesis protein CcmG/thiol:disulfide interchange protein DsbE
MFKCHPILTSIVILFFSAAWIGFTSIKFQNPENGLILAPKEGFLPPDFTLDSSSNTSYTLSDYHGQVVLINFWTSWCPSCKAEMPAMQRVYERYKDEGFIILGINATQLDNLSRVSEFIGNQSLTFPVLLDTDGKTTQLYQIRSFPSSFFIDKNEVISEVVIGGPMAEALILTRVETLIKEDE